MDCLDLDHCTFFRFLFDIVSSKENCHGVCVSNAMSGRHNPFIRDLKCIMHYEHWILRGPNGSWVLLDPNSILWVLMGPKGPNRF